MSEQHGTDASPERLVSALMEKGALTSDWLPAFKRALPSRVSASERPIFSITTGFWRSASSSQAAIKRSGVLSCSVKQAITRVESALEALQSFDGGGDDEVEGHARVWSDENLKQAITKMEGALETLRQLSDSQES